MKYFAVFSKELEKSLKKLGKESYVTKTNHQENKRNFGKS